MNGTMYIPISASVLSTAAELARQCSATGNRSCSQNLALAITTCYGVPCRHEHASLIIPGTLGTGPTRSPRLYEGIGRASSLYRRAESARGHLGSHGAGVAGTAQPDVAEFFTSPFERSATTRPSTSSSA